METVRQGLPGGLVGWQALWLSCSRGWPLGGVALSWPVSAVEFYRGVLLLFVGALLCLATGLRLQFEKGVPLYCFGLLPLSLENRITMILL